MKTCKTCNQQKHILEFSKPLNKICFDYFLLSVANASKTKLFQTFKKINKLNLVVKNVNINQKIFKYYVNIVHHLIILQ
jgi:hypothetical protein